MNKRQRRLAGFDDKVLALYARGQTTREIQTHQPRHAMLSHPVALFAERPPNTRTAVGLATVLMEYADGDQARPIGDRPPTLGTSTPRIIPRRGDRQCSAHEADRIVTVVLLDRPVSHWDSFAKNTAARFKKSRSSFKVAFSRFSRARSSCSAHIDWRVWPWHSAWYCSARQQ